MKNQIAHITRRISVVAGLVAAFTLAPALSSIKSADAAPKWERKFEKRQEKRERKFERRQDRRENRWERRNRSNNNRWSNSSWNRNRANNSWNNRRYHTKYKTIWRNGRPYRQYYRVYY